MKDNKNPKIKKQKELPHAYVILFVILVVAMIATWIVPAGSYSRYLDENSGRTVVDPTSYAPVEASPVGPFDMVISSRKV